MEKTTNISECGRAARAYHEPRPRPRVIHVMKAFFKNHASRLALERGPYVLQGRAALQVHELQVPDSCSKDRPSPVARYA